LLGGSRVICIQKPGITNCQIVRSVSLLFSARGAAVTAMVCQDQKIKSNQNHNQAIILIVNKTLFNQRGGWAPRARTTLLARCGPDLKIGVIV